CGGSPQNPLALAMGRLSLRTDGAYWLFIGVVTQPVKERETTIMVVKRWCAFQLFAHQLLA
ncbi:MAG: hypothetical protein ACUVSC_05615, partial [Candidatus Fervidibacter sp.]|uniref:hypothetical protein n=1 Tax=Candidatus Fervidibacter sp. TaxID=3100871 RepID=UPI00404B31F5